MSQRDNVIKTRTSTLRGNACCFPWLYTGAKMSQRDNPNVDLARECISFLCVVTPWLLSLGFKHACIAPAAPSARPAGTVNVPA